MVSSRLAAVYLYDYAVRIEVMLLDSEADSLRLLEAVVVSVRESLEDIVVGDDRIGHIDAERLVSCSKAVHYCIVTCHILSVDVECIVAFLEGDSSLMLCLGDILPAAYCRNVSARKRIRNDCAYELSVEVTLCYGDSCSPLGLVIL